MTDWNHKKDAYDDGFDDGALVAIGVLLALANLGIAGAWVWVVLL